VEKIRVEHQGVGGMAWAAFWLFTIGYLHLTFWKGVAALIMWPYYLGIALSRLPS